MSEKQNIKEKATDLFKKYSEKVQALKQEAIQGRKWVNSSIIGFNGYTLEITINPSGDAFLRFVSPNRRNSFIIANTDALDAIKQLGKWLEENHSKVNILISVLGVKAKAKTQTGEFEL